MLRIKIMRPVMNQGVTLTLTVPWGQFVCRAVELTVEASTPGMLYLPPSRTWPVREPAGSSRSTNRRAEAKY